MAKRQKNAGEMLNDLAKHLGAQFAYCWDNGNWSFWLPDELARIDVVLRKDGNGYSLRLTPGWKLKADIKKCGFDIVDLRDPNDRKRMQAETQRAAEQRAKNAPKKRTSKAAKTAKTGVASASMLRLIGPIYGEG